MRRLFCSIVCMLSVLSVFGQNDGLNKSLTIREAMDIVAYRRNHPFVDEDEFDGFVNTIMKSHGYIDSDYLEGVGTCFIWQFIKHGHTVHNVEPLDDDYFIPDNIQKASTAAVFDCNGIETIEDDETAISVEMRVFTEGRRDELMKEIQKIGFTYKKTDYYGREYTWQTYVISVREGSSRGYKYWEFSARLNARDYGSTKHYEYADSSTAHNLKIHMEYPVKGNPVLLRRVRTFIMEALEHDILNGGPMTGRYNGDFYDGQSVVNYYGQKGTVSLKEKHDGPYGQAFEEETTIKKVAENDYFVSYEVFRLGWYGGVLNELLYGATFRKSDGKRLHVIADPKDSKFKHFLNNDLFFEKKDEIEEEYRSNIPMPKYEPYLIQSGVRFVYQKYEIAGGASGYIKGDASFPEIKQFLTKDVKDVLGQPSSEKSQMVIRPDMLGYNVDEDIKVQNDMEEGPRFPNGNAALFEYMNRNLKYPVIAEENGIQGDVEIQFVVEKDGSITNVAVSKSVDPSLDKEAIRVVRNMPKWSPAKKNGVIVRSQQHLTIPFRLGGSHQESQTSSMQNTQAWFLFGSKNELMEQGVFKDGQVLHGKFNKDYFTKIDTRIDKEIKLYSKSARILTSHPVNSFILKPDENRLYVLRITDPQQFWSTSEYLVILVE